jgi:PAS domain S-box-containing protein
MKQQPSCPAMQRKTVVKKAKGGYQHCEERLRLLESAVVNANDAIAITEADVLDEPLGPSIVYVNEAFTRMSGYTAAEVIGKTPRILQGEKTDRTQLDKIRAALLRGEPVRTELLNYRKDGSEYWVELNIVPLCDCNGKVTHFVSVQRDICDRKRTEAALRESERKFRAIFNGTFQFTGLLLPDGILLEANQAALDFGGLQQKDVIGYFFWQARWWTISKATQNQLKLAIALAATGEFVRYEVDILGAGDRVVTIDFSLKPVFDETGKVALLIAEGRDITELKQAREALRRANEELEMRVEERTAALKATNRQLLLEIAERKQTENALKKSEERFRNLVETSSDWVWEVDENGCYTYASPKVRDILGYEPEEIVGKSPFDFMPAKEAERVGNIFGDRAAAREPIKCLENRNIHKDGHWVVLETSGIPIFDATGKLRGYRGIDRDISDRKQTEQALRSSEECFRLLVEGVKDYAIFMLDPKGLIVSWNLGAERILGYQIEEIIGQHFSRFFPTKDISRGLPNQDLNIAAATGRFEHEGWRIRQDGSVFWANVVTTPLRDRTGQLRGFSKVIRDITESKRTERALRSSEERYRLMAENSSDIISRHTPKGIYLYISPACRTLLGYEPQALIGHSAYEFFHPEDKAALQQYHDSILKNEAIVDVISYRCRCKNGSYVWLETTAKRICNRDTDVVEEIIAVSRDITARKQSEEALRRQLAAVEAATDGIGIVNAQGEYLYLNNSHIKIFGYNNVNELIGKSWHEIYDCDEAERIEREVIPIVVQQGKWQGEATGTRRDGTKFSQEISLTLVADGGLICVCRDISDRKSVEEKLRLTDRALAASSNGIVISDARLPDAPNIYVNSAFERLTGYQASEALGRNCRFLQGPETEQAELEKLRAAMKEGKDCTVVLRNYRKDGTLFWNELTVSPIYDAHGNLTHYLGIQTDISDRKSAEAQLQQAKDQLRAVLDAVPGLVSWINSDLRYMGVNRHLAATFQQPAAAFVGQEIGFLESSREFAEFMRCFFAQDVYKSSKEVSIDIDGEPRSYLIAAQKYHQGQAAVSVGIDITERKRMEEKLRETTSRLTALIQNLQAGILVKDESKRIVLVNQEFCTLLGIPHLPESLLGQDFYQFPEAYKHLFAQPEQFVQRITTILNNREVVTNEELQLADNRIFERDYVPIFVEGNYCGHLWMYRDITARKQAETTLLITRERLQYLLSSSPGVIYSAKVTGDYGATFMSENAAAMLGYQAREFVEDPSFWASHIHPEDAPEVFANLPSLLDHGQHNNEYRFLHRDGTYRWIYDQAKLVRDEKGNPVEIVGYWADISDRKQLEQDLRQALEKEKELGELKSRFVSMTSHEFRTPLSTILSSSELLEHYRHKWTEDKQLLHLRRIQTAVKHMTHMLNDILIIGKAEAGKLEFKSALLDLAEFCDHLVEEVQLNASKTHAIAFTSKGDPSTGYFDEKLLRHILSNLLSNAIKYSPSGSTVNFTLTCENNRAVFEIQDQGIGIPQEDLPRMFESFHRATNVGNIQGTGLGLAIVKKCVDRHQGDIAVTSEIGTGTTFTVTLPLNNEILLEPNHEQDSGN